MDGLARAAGRLATALLCGMALSAAPAQAGVERARIVGVRAAERR